MNQTNSGLVAQIAGAAIGADTFLPNMGTDEYLSCLSRPALEAICAKTTTHPRNRVRDTRAALVAEFEPNGYVHPAGRFKPDRAIVKTWQEQVANALDAAARRTQQDEAREDEGGEHEPDIDPPEQEEGVEDVSEEALDENEHLMAAE